MNKKNENTIRAFNLKQFQEVNETNFAHHNRFKI